MAGEKPSAAKAILLAVEAASNADVATLRQLKAQYPTALKNDLILRILLRYLPENVNSSEYVPLLEEIAGVKFEGESLPINSSSVDDLSDEEAKARVNKLHLSKLAWPGAPKELEDSLSLFLIHRSYQIDEQNGMICQIPELFDPFLERSPIMRSWFISTVLPLLRFNFEYYPQRAEVTTLEDIEQMNDRDGISFLLSKTATPEHAQGDGPNHVGRDLRGLVGPWMYGDSNRKRRKFRRNSERSGQNIQPLSEKDDTVEEKCRGWEEVFKWLTSQATTSWNIAVQGIEDWDGPGDVDFGGYEAGSGTWLEEEEQAFLERRYARAALACAYLIPESSVEAMKGIHKILARIIALLDYDRIPTLDAAASLLSPVPTVVSEVQSSEHIRHIRRGLLEESNILTTPSESATAFLHACLISAFILTRAGHKCSISRACEMALAQDKREQTAELHLLIHAIGPSTANNKQWIRTRNEILWLRDWGAEELSDPDTAQQGRGVFGTIKKDALEAEILKLLLKNNCYDLAREIYEKPSEHPLSAQQLKEIVVAASMSAFDNATNANRTRGGVKKADEIIHAFPETLRGSSEEKRGEALLKLTHSIGQYRLVLKQGEPFQPVYLRTHKEPLTLLGKVLEQNPKSYTKIKDIIEMAHLMIDAGLTNPELARDSEPSVEITEQIKQEKDEATVRITSMCVDNALAEDDFETAYSYVMSSLESVARPATISATPFPNAPAATGNTGLVAALPPKTIDDWSWRAALQTGKYKRNDRTLRPTHLGNSPSNLEIRHLEQRMECLSLATKLAPTTALTEVLNVYRRCEEELETKTKLEAEEQEKWDDKGDQSLMPGSFDRVVPAEAQRSSGRQFARPDNSTANAAGAQEEAPMSLFDLTRASAAQAQRSLGALSALQARATGKLRGEGQRVSSGGESASVGGDNTETAEKEKPAGEPRTRKRDQLANAAVGTLASGLGWVLGAPAEMRNPQRESSGSEQRARSRERSRERTG